MGVVETSRVAYNSGETQNFLFYFLAAVDSGEIPEKAQNDVLVLSSMLPFRQEPLFYKNRYFINLDGYLLTTSVLKDV